jgi:hypothetical protein
VVGVVAITRLPLLDPMVLLIQVLEVEVALVGLEQQAVATEVLV